MLDDRLLPVLVLLGMLDVRTAASQPCPATLDDAQELVAADSAPADALGNAAAIDGDTLLVGAVYDTVGGVHETGSVRVFSDVDGTWLEGDPLVAPWPQAGQRFGRAVAIDAGHPVVGAGADATHGYQAGRAFTWELDGLGGWVFDGPLEPPNPQVEERFGTAVALSGDLAVVGAYLHDGPAGSNSGAAFVFSRVLGSWGPGIELPGRGPEFREGGAVAVDAGTVVLGGAAANSRRGAATVYQCDAFGSCDAGFALEPLASGLLEPGDYFGTSVAVSGERVAVGASQDESGGPGHVYVFRRDPGDVWTLEDDFGGCEPELAGYFGGSLALDGDELLVSSLRESPLLGGAAHLLHREGIEWVEHLRLHAPDGTANDSFGRCVALGGAWAVVGASSHDHLGADAGAAYAFPALAPTVRLRRARLPVAARPPNGVVHGLRAGCRCSVRGDRGGGLAARRVRVLPGGRWPGGRRPLRRLRRCGGRTFAVCARQTQGENAGGTTVLRLGGGTR